MYQPDRSSVVTCASCECGIPVHTPATRIVGGSEAVPYSWPWQVAIDHWFFFWMFQCGGTLIAPKWIITAAHCVYGDESSPQNFRVKLGVFKHSSSNEEGEQIVGIKTIYRHTQYNPNNFLNDVALLELDVPVTYSDTILPVCLPQNDSYVLTNGNPVTQTGWGTTWPGALTVSGKLRQVTVPIVDLLKCRQDYAQYSHGIWDTNFCAGEEGKETCQGDSGGPTVHKDGGGRWIQYGITSWGHDCGLQDYPGVYTRVSPFCHFIHSTTKLNLCKY